MRLIPNRDEFRNWRIYLFIHVPAATPLSAPLVKRPSHRNPMYFSEVSVDGVFESLHRGSCYNLLWESIPCVDNTLTEVVLSDIKENFFLYLVSLLQDLRDLCFTPVCSELTCLE